MVEEVQCTGLIEVAMVCSMTQNLVWKPTHGISVIFSVTNNVETNVSSICGVVLPPMSPTANTKLPAVHRPTKSFLRKLDHINVN